MLQAKVHRLSKTYGIAGKVFILGEYGVLAGLPALIAAIPPRFQMKVFSDPELSKSFQWPSGSPIARYLAWAKKAGYPELGFEFVDPFQGAGGFGASTAQFAMAYLAHSQFQNQDSGKVSQVWNLYRELMHSDSILPSGADLASQWQGGVVFFDSSDGRCQDIWPLFDWSQLLVFSTTHQAGRKVPTHDHLRTLVERGFPKSQKDLLLSLENLLMDGIAAVQDGNAIELGRVMSLTASALQKAELEVEATTLDRQALSGLPDVLGVKGAGALQSDAILVLVKARSLHRDSIIQAASARGLRLLCDGLTCEMGVTCQSP